MKSRRDQEKEEEEGMKRAVKKRGKVWRTRSNAKSRREEWRSRGMRKTKSRRKQGQKRKEEGGVVVERGG